MAKKFFVIAGQFAAKEIDDLRNKMVKPSAHTPETFDSESLVSFQRRMFNMGFIEAEIVASIYGYSLRYATGLLDFGLIRSSRHGEIDGSYAGALAAAEKWQAQDSAKRYVTFSNYNMSRRAEMDAIAEKRKIKA